MSIDVVVINDTNLIPAIVYYNTRLNHVINLIILLKTKILFKRDIFYRMDSLPWLLPYNKDMRELYLYYWNMTPRARSGYQLYT
jgi:hypothetical protein